MKKRLYMVHAQGRYGENVYIPYTCGLLWAYARTFPEIANAYEMVDFLYLKEPIETAVARLEDPQLLAISHYIWNAEWNKAFAKAVKLKFPSCIIIVGGVQVPDESPRILEENPEFDAAVYGEGEGAFVDFLRAHLEDGPTNYVGVGSLIYRTHCAIVVNQRRPFTDLAELRSPYLDGVFDALWPREPRWQILHETGTRGCPYASFAGDTLVALPDRIVRLDEEVYSHKTTLPCPDLSHVHRVGKDDPRLVSQGQRECLKLSFSNGLSLTVTPSHPMLVVRNEKIVDSKACELEVGDWIPVEIGQNTITKLVPLVEPSKTKAENLASPHAGQGRRVPETVDLPKHLTDEVAWLTGYLIGDGCLPADDRPAVQFAVDKRTLVPLKAVVENLFGLPLKIHDSSFTTKMQHGTIHSRKVAQFFRESLGMQSGEAKLKVPRAIFRSPGDVVRAFLDGLWCADGYWPTQKAPYLTTVSEQLANECAALIHWIGDAALVRKIKVGEREGTFKNHKPFVYRIEWHGEDCRKRLYGRPCVASHVPAIRHTYRDRKGVLRLRTTPQNNCCREGSPRVVLQHFEPKHPLLDRRFVFVKVKSIKAAGTRETYDVHHHPEHKIAANGAYVRQCSFCAWGQAALNDVRQIPDERVIAEIDWFGRHKIFYVDGCDANFGLLKRDVSLTKHLAATKAKYGYPQTFRTSFAKNSNEVVWEIANILSDAKMLKSVTLAMQSMDDEVLINIKRKNIKFNKFGDLLKRYEDAGIPTYTELILGLPGESLDMFLDGIDKNLEAGQHAGLFCYLNILLNNTEQKDPKYIAAHGLRALPMKAMLTHGTPDNTVPREMQDIIVETAAMPHDDWKQAYLYSKVIEIFHAQGLLQNVAIALHDRDGVKYRDFYSHLTKWLRLRPTTVAGREFATLEQLLDGVLAGGLWDCQDDRLGEISWPPEEFAFARICLEKDTFYDEIEDFLLGQGVEDDEIASQREVIAPPWDDTVAWSREVIWYGRKSTGAKLRQARTGGE